jgi:hypothetical protein
MSHDFDADWLHLRAPLDEAARVAAFAWGFGRVLPSEPVMIDLGAGTGNNVRQLALKLGRAQQEWTLIEKDRKLLAKAPGEMQRWAERNGWTVKEQRRAYVINCEDMAIRVEMRSCDIARNLTDLGVNQYDGLTANALFDLVSVSWLEGFADELAGGGYPPLLFTMNVDGRVTFSTPDPDDAFVLERFHAHMGKDKGFGPALGPAAPAAMVKALTRAGYKVEQAPSDWNLGEKQLPVHLALLDFYAQGATEMEPPAAARIQEWCQRRQAMARTGGAGLQVGHMDIFARR